MKSGKNMVWMVAGVLVAILLIGSAAMLIVGYGQLAMSESKLQKLLGTWKEFSRRNPFPCRENIGIEQENAKTVNGWHGDILKVFGKTSLEPEKRTPSKFIALLGERRNKMQEMVDQAGIVVPQNFGFGFGRYFVSGSPLPAPEDVPVLSQQLTVAENLCRLLAESGVKEVSAIDREKFEGTPESVAEEVHVIHAGVLTGEGGAAPQQAGVKPGSFDGGLPYGRLHFVLAFKAKEAAVWQVLNKLAASDMITAVTLVQMEAEGPDVTKLNLAAVGAAADPQAADVTKNEKTKPTNRRPKPKPDAAVEKPADKPVEKVNEKLSFSELPREDREVCGPAKAQPMKVIIELDVYRFKTE